MTLRLPSKAALFAGSLFFGALALGCTCESAAEISGSASSGPSPGASATGSAAPPVPSTAQPPRASAEPIGPELVVLPGIGISAIRFGTNFETLARHMEGPCQIRTETRCVYVDQAVDFTMKDGVVSAMKVYRRGREVPGVPGKLFGFFKGFLPPKIQLGLHRHIVAEEIGTKPESVEEFPAANGGFVVAREKYHGLIIEYDRLANGNTVAATFEVIRASDAQPEGPVKIPVK